MTERRGLFKQPLILMVGSGFAGSYLYNHKTQIKRLGKRAMKGIIREMVSEESREPEREFLNAANPAIEELLSQISLLKAEVRYLSNSSSNGWISKGNIVLTLVGAAAALFFWVKGYSYKDLVYVSCSTFEKAVSILENAIDTVREQLSSRIDWLVQKSEAEHSEIQQKIEVMGQRVGESVDEVSGDIEDLQNSVKEIREILSSLMKRTITSESKLDKVLSHTESIHSIFSEMNTTHDKHHGLQSILSPNPTPFYTRYTNIA